MPVSGRTRVGRNEKTRQGRRFANLPPMLKIAFLGLALSTVIAVFFFISAKVQTMFRVDEVVFSGNTHLADEELQAFSGIRGGESLLTLSHKKIHAQLMQSPWIRDAAVRKEFPGRLLIRIRETEPFALMDIKGHLFIVDDKGRMLEELKNSSIPFLPVITGIPYGKKETVSHALELVKVIRGRGLLADREHIEIIARKPQEITVNIDGIIVKVGEGEYDDKLQRLVELEEEIRKRGIHVDYIDLRFAHKAVVRPVNEVIN